MTDLQSKAEINYRKLVAIRKAGHLRSKIEQEFHRVYGKWPNALELEQARPFLKVREKDQ